MIIWPHEEESQREGEPVPKNTAEVEGVRLQQHNKSTADDADYEITLKCCFFTNLFNITFLNFQMYEAGSQNLKAKNICMVRHTRTIHARTIHNKTATLYIKNHTKIFIYNSFMCAELHVTAGG